MQLQKYDSLSKIIYHLNQTFGSLFKKNDYSVNFDDIFTKHDVTQLPKKCADELVKVEDNYKHLLTLFKHVSFLDKKVNQKLASDQVITVLDEYFKIPEDSRSTKSSSSRSADDMLYTVLSHINANLTTSVHLANMKQSFKLQSDVNRVIDKTINKNSKHMNGKL